MTDIRKAAKMVLNVWDSWGVLFDREMEALRQALAQPEHEREWIDLDEEEQKECWDEGGSQRAIYQNIASKLKEKNT